MTTSTSRSSRLSLRITPQQDAVLRRAAKLTNKSLTDFILDSAYLVAEQTLLNQQLPLNAQAFVEWLDRPPQDNAALQALLNRPAPWSH